MLSPLKGLTLAVAMIATAEGQFVQQGSKLVGSGSIGNPEQGWSVAVSADGNTVLIGGYNDHSNAGAAWVFARSGGAWTQEAKLTGIGSAFFGTSVALSADGNTAVIGSPVDDLATGAAWIFTRSGGVWTQQGSKLVGSGSIGAADQGSSVAVSADGNTVLVGGPVDNNGVGAVWVFIRNGGVWTQQGSKLVGSGVMGSAQQGYAVALSADGNTAIVGAPDDNRKPSGAADGATWVFSRAGGVWTQQGNKLVGSGAIGAGGAHQGKSVAVSADGSTALVGAHGDNASVGAAWVFTRSGGLWTQEGNKLVGSGATGIYPSSQGQSVALSADGNTALIGGPQDNNGLGAVWVFKRRSGAWMQQGNKLVGTGTSGNVAQGVGQGNSVALSANGSTAVIGGPFDSSAIGAVWVFIVPHVRDFNADARSDALMYDPSTGTAFTALSNAGGSFQYVYNLFSPGFDFPRTGDFNGDGWKDLVLYNSQTGIGYIGMSKGDGTFNFQSLFLPVALTSIETGDLNGDGKTDLVLLNDDTSLMYAGISNGDGTFAYKTTFVGNNGRTLAGVGDFTGDGKADVFLYSPGNGTAHLAVGDGSGAFLSHFVFLSAGYTDLQVGDLNGDGKADLVLYDSTFGKAATGISDGFGGFNFRPMLFTPGFTSIRLADFTGDAKDDLTLYNSRTGLGYFGTGAGDGTFAFQSLFWSPGYDQVVAQDLNGDFKTDILLYNALTGTAYAGISNGDGTFTYTYSLWRRGQKIVDQ